ncbi:GTPase HflX [Dyadobacter sp. 3J3]|uniref:GTPase HflX n=1 Tax=Dyadobacter sp. 3J3 TaxID=2606600 RepID=UPI001E57A5FA|nr:GTPase HflX [Dyadobacter sp. 3J3]
MKTNKIMHETTANAENAILVAVSTQKQNAVQTKEYLKELAFLAKTLMIQSVGEFVQNLPHPDAKTYIGTGKLEEIKTFLTANPVQIVLFDDQLSPKQLRNLEKAFEGIRVMDRGALILQIFEMRARTAQSKLQVEVAKLQYLLPRMSRMTTDAESKSSDDGKRAGGETDLENSRRTIKDRIVLLKEKLEKIDQQGMTQRKQRDRIVRATLVGYTNVGKSTLMNYFSKADVYAKDELFATVDSTVRNVRLSGIPFLLTDTVGFIRKLPALLIDSFKSTLDEVREADVLLHVADISHPAWLQQVQVVNAILSEIGADHIPVLLIFNKIDLLGADDLDSIIKENAEAITAITNTGKSFGPVYISVAKEQNMNELVEILSAIVNEKNKGLYPG